MLWLELSFLAGLDSLSSKAAIKKLAFNPLISYQWQKHFRASDWSGKKP